MYTQVLFARPRPSPGSRPSAKASCQCLTSCLFPALTGSTSPPYESYEKLYEKLLTAVEGRPVALPWSEVHPRSRNTAHGHTRPRAAALWMPL